MSIVLMPTPQPFMYNQYYPGQDLTAETEIHLTPPQHQYNISAASSYHGLNMSQQDAHGSRSMQPPPPPPSSASTTTSMPIDPSLTQAPMYQGQYYGHYQSPPHHHSTPSQSGHHSQVSLAASLSSASSPSDAMSTPPTEQLAFASPGKRPSSASTEGDRKRQKQEDDPSASPVDKEGAPKAKPTRGSRFGSALIPKVSGSHHHTGHAQYADA